MTDCADRIIIQNDQLPSILVGNDVLLPVKIDITTNGSISWISISRLTSLLARLTNSPPLSRRPICRYFLLEIIQFFSNPRPVCLAIMHRYESTTLLSKSYFATNLRTGNTFFFSLKLVWYPWTSCDREIYEMHYDAHDTKLRIFHLQFHSTNLPNRVSESEFICQPFYAFLDPTIIAIMMWLWQSSSLSICLEGHSIPRNYRRAAIGDFKRC